MWSTPEERLALLELLTRCTLKRRISQSSAFEVLSELAWTRATGQRDQIRLVENRRQDLLALIDRVWPNWQQGLTELSSLGLPPTPDGWERLLDARRANEIPVLPERINRRTAGAIVAPHSKAMLTENRLAALGETEATHDGSVRLRPPSGLVARTHRGMVDLSAVANVLGEVAIPERAFLDGLQLEGALRGVLLVENLGAWRDLPVLEGWLLAHVPGWDTVTVSHLLARLDKVLTVHFGDLDPNGVRIYQHLRNRRPDLRWFIPSFWGELIDSHGLPTSWPPDLDLSDAPPLVHELVARGLWLEQEAVVVDSRVAEAINALIQTG